MLAEVEEEKTLFALILVNAYKLINKYIFCFGIPLFLSPLDLEGERDGEGRGERKCVKGER